VRRDHNAHDRNSAGFAGAFIDREAETRGMDFIDREKAKVSILILCIRIHVLNWLFHQRDAAQQVSDVSLWRHRTWSYIWLTCFQGIDQSGQFGGGDSGY
jgi:hypothetical protein